MSKQEKLLINKVNYKDGKKREGSNGFFHQTKIDIPLKVRLQVIKILNQTLADTLDLKSQVKQAHWNVKGMQFISLHELFDAIAGELESYIDMFAERITTLGGTAMGTARMAAKTSCMPEYPLSVFEGSAHLNALVERLALLSSSLRDKIKEVQEMEDFGTADLYTEVSREIDKRLWFLEAHLQA